MELVTSITNLFNDVVSIADKRQQWTITRHYTEMCVCAWVRSRARVGERGRIRGASASKATLGLEM
jgi:hypothetical protein